jgi:hypothetical protein
MYQRYAVLGTVVMAVILPGKAIAQNITSATITDIIEGNQVFIQSRQARVNETARQREQVRTGAARAELRFNNQAIARLGRNTVLTVGQCGAQMERGSMLVNGAVPSCSSQVTAAVRGTTYLFELDDDGEESISVLEGEVEVRRLVSDDDDDDDNDDDRRSPRRRERVFQVRAGDRLIRSRRQRRTFVRAISDREFDSVLTGPLFRGYRRSLPVRSLDRIEQFYRRRFPNRRFPLRTAAATPLNPNRGHFTLVVQQDRPQLREVVARVSLVSRRGNGYLPERFVGDFLMPLNRPVQFIRGLNPEDRVVVRIFEPQGRRLLGYSEFELLDDQAAAFIILPNRPNLGVVRTVIGLDRDRDAFIDWDERQNFYSFFTRLDDFEGEDYLNARVRFVSPDELPELRDDFNSAVVPFDTFVNYPPSFTRGSLTVVSRTLRVFSTTLEPILRSVPFQGVEPIRVPVNRLLSVDVPVSILRYRR